MSPTVTEQTVRALAPEPDQLWTAVDRDAALAALLDRVGAGPVAPAVVGETDEPHGGGPQHRRWSRHVAVAASVVALLVGLGAVLLTLDRPGPRSTVVPGVGVTTPRDVPSAGPVEPIGPFEIPLDHTGAYDWTSDPFPLTSPPGSPSPVLQILGGHEPVQVAARVAVTAAAVPGTYVVVADFDIVSFEPGTVLRIDFPTTHRGGAVSQVGPACRQSSGAAAR